MMPGALRTGLVYREAMHVVLPALLLVLLARVIQVRRRRHHAALELTPTRQP